MNTKSEDSFIVLGFDFGTKRIGMAIGQKLTKVARPLTTISAKEGIPQWDKISQLIKRWQPKALVVGIPYNMDGSDQPMTQNARSFASMLGQRYQLDIFEVDERLTTVSAREELFNDGGYQSLQAGQVDAKAAQLILQAWLDNLPAPLSS